MESKNCVKQLRLISAFKARGYGRNWLEYIDKEDSVFYVYDDNATGISKRSPDDSPGCIVVQNKSGEDCALLKIDTVLFKSGTSCDCAVLSVNALRLNEFKTNCETTHPETITERYEKAVSQLSETYAFVRDAVKAKGIDIKEVVDVSANVLMPPQYPKTNSTILRYKRLFQKRNRIELTFNKEIEI